MTAVDTDESMPAIRERYNEFLLGDAWIAEIADPENPTAWIRSDTTTAIQP